VRLGGVLIGAALLAMSSVALAADDNAPICADRPGKATPTCTVPAGMLQIESGLADWSDDHGTGTLAVGGTAVKFGVTGRLHLELDLPAYVDVRHGSSGLGDSATTLKYRLTSGSAPVQFAIRPFVKIPTARHSLGNGKVEGGIALLADSSFAGSQVGWDVAPELDLVADADGSGYHVAMVQTASVGVPLSSRITLSGELWGAWDFDPAGTVRQFSIDGALAYLLGKDVQVDAGVNFGLNRNTPGVEIYSGIAFRF
jgi:hypothetical protein